jgi:hypothetical protein
MKKILKLLCLGLTAVVLSLCLTGRVHARINSDDAGCWGAGSVEVCLTSAGLLAPSTTGGGSLGSSTLLWSSVNASAIVPTNTSSSRLHIPYATSITSQTMLTVTTTAGDEYYLYDAGNSRVWAKAVSTGGVNALVFSSNPIVAARQGP